MRAGGEGRVDESVVKGLRRGNVGDAGGGRGWGSGRGRGDRRRERGERPGEVRRRRLAELAHNLRSRVTKTPCVKVRAQPSCANEIERH